jgi:2-dehydro-3-deoxyphosphogluconate aldolase/(4S)-4-hydroxy-2-oxoglutarate aldolase
LPTANNFHADDFINVIMHRMNSQPDDIRKRLTKDGLVAIIRGDFAAEDYKKIAKSLMAGGIHALEVTLNSSGALTAIHTLRRDFPDLLIGAGTVRDVAGVQAATDAGAMFLIAPNLNLEAVKTASGLNTLMIPGIFTATEAHQAQAAGCQLVKLFPADQVGPGYLKALRAPLSDIDFMPTGGVTPETLEAFYQAGAVAFGIGSYLVKQVSMSDTEAQALTARARQLRDELKRLRGSRDSQ